MTFMVGKEGLRIGRLPIGEYDDSILTEDGERHFSEWDDYAAKFFLNRRGYNDGKEGQIFTVGGLPAYAELKPGDFCPESLRLFCMSVLWRAGVSGRPFFREIRLGDQEVRLRSLLLARDPGPTSEFSVILRRYADTPASGWPMLAPRMKRFDDGTAFCRFMLPDMVFDVKLGGKALSDDLDVLVVGASKELVIGMNQFYRDTPMYKGLIEALRERSRDSPRGESRP